MAYCNNTIILHNVRKTIKCYIFEESINARNMIVMFFFYISSRYNVTVINVVNDDRT